MMEPIDTPYGFPSMWRYVKVGIALTLFLFFGIGVWGLTAEIAGAIVASGKVEVTSDLKKVQHLTGGVVAEIFVKDGMQVKQGDPLIRLDETVARANLAMIEKSLNELKASGARLLAERDGLSEILFPSVLTLKASDPAVYEIIENEKRLFELRRKAREGNKAQLNERITQLEQEIVGNEAQINSLDGQTKFIQEELRAARELWEKNLIPLAKISSLEREATRLEGDKGRLVAAIAQTRGRISEARVAILQIDRDLNSEVAKELREGDAKISELEERRVSAQYQLDHIMIEAPQDGIVHHLAMKTIGGVISPADVIMEIVPILDNLVVTVRISPIDIDQIQIGADVRLRFTAFNQRTTPELNGKLINVSADVTVEEKTGATYYTGRVSLRDEEIKKLKGLTLLPGMPAEVYVYTHNRTVASLLFKPFQDQMQRAFRQD